MSVTIFNTAVAPNLQFSWDNVLRRSGATVVVSAGDESRLSDWRRDRRWAPGAGAQTVTITLPTPEVIDHFWIMSHNLATDGATLLGEYYDGSWLPLFNTSPLDNTLFWVDFDYVYTDQLRLTVTGTAPEIGQLFFGQVMGSEVPLSPPYTPIGMGVNRDAFDFINNGGVLGSRQARSLPEESTLSLDMMSHDWVRDVFLPFRDHANNYPWVMRWNSAFPDETCWAWTRNGPPPPISYKKSIHVSTSWPIYQVDE